MSDETYPIGSMGAVAKHGAPARHWTAGNGKWRCMGLILPIRRGTGRWHGRRPALSARQAMPQATHNYRLGAWPVYSFTIHTGGRELRMEILSRYGPPPPRLAICGAPVGPARERRH